MENWIYENMQAIMIGIGLASLIGVVVIFALYFSVQRKVRKKKLSK